MGTKKFSVVDVEKRLKSELKGSNAPIAAGLIFGFRAGWAMREEAERGIEEIEALLGVLGGILELPRGKILVLCVQKIKEVFEPLITGGSEAQGGTN